MKKKQGNNPVKQIYLSAQKLIEKENKEIRLNEKKQFIYFVIGFILFYLLITFTISFIPQEYFKQSTGESVELILSLIGHEPNTEGFVSCEEAYLVYSENEGKCYSFTLQDKTIHIAWLCTGVLEIIILVSAILASFGIKNKQKMVGVVLAIIVGVGFNLVRIILTISVVLTQNNQLIEFTHDWLFRIVLFVYITVFYVIWFYWANRKENETKK